MNVINEYHISGLDLSKLEKYILQHGTLRALRKKDYLVKQNDLNSCIGYISKGMFRYTRIDNLGNEHIVGYSLEKEFIGDYVANLCNRRALVSIQAIVDSDVYIINYSEVIKLWNSSMEYQELGRLLAEQLFAMSYRRLIDSYCCTSEERYMSLMKCYPNLKNLIPLKEIASFIGVTPETLSNIRRRLLRKS